jgi:hypothetical protein
LDAEADVRIGFADARFADVDDALGAARARSEIDC